VVRSRSGRACVGAVVAGLVFAGCSGGGKKDVEVPDPAPGTVAAFDLNGLDSRYDLQQAVSDMPFSSHVAAGRSGDAFVMHRTSSDGSTDILRLTSQGAVSRFASLGPGRAAYGFAALPDGSLAVGRGGTVLRVTGHGAPATLPTGHRFTGLVPIGARPDGSLVVLDGDQVWSVKDGRSTVLAGKPSNGGSYGTVDGSGTTYALLDGKNTVRDVLVIPPGKAPHALRVTGQLPGGSAPVSGLSLYTFAAAGDDGFYATAGTESDTARYLIHVHGTTAEVLAAFGAPDRVATCAAGHHYPALDNPCVMPFFALPLGKRVLLVGKSNADLATPALAVDAASSGGVPVNRQVRGAARK
jgi:hypothetical protein